MVEGEGFEPSKAVPADLQSDPFGHWEPLHKCGAHLIKKHFDVKEITQLFCLTADKANNRMFLCRFYAD